MQLYIFFLRNLINKYIKNKQELNIADANNLFVSILLSNPFYKEIYNELIIKYITLEQKEILEGKELKQNSKKYLNELPNGDYSLVSRKIPDEPSYEEQIQERVKKVHIIINKIKNFISGKDGKVSYSELEKIVNSSKLSQEFDTDFIIQELFNYGIIYLTLPQEIGDNQIIEMGKNIYGDFFPKYYMPSQTIVKNKRILYKISYEISCFFWNMRFF